MGVVVATILVPAGLGQVPARPARAAHGALNSAIDSYRRGDYELADTLFQQAKLGMDELSDAEKQELNTWLPLNNRALQARKDGAEQVRQAEAALQAGRAADADRLLNAVSVNLQFLTPADKQRVQRIAERLRPGTAATATPPAAGTDPHALARTKLQQARVLGGRGMFDAAEALAREADQLHVTYSWGEDTPRRVLDDVAKARTDPKVLLGAARAALQENQLDRAEMLAHQAEKASSIFATKIKFWGDSPSKVLKDVQAARARQMTAGTNPNGAGPGVPAPKEGQRNIETMKFQDGSTPSPAVGDDKPRPGTGSSSAATPGPSAKSAQAPGVQTATNGAANTEKARQLVQQGKKALAEKRYAEARQLGLQASSLKPDLKWWEDTPEKLLADVARAEAGAQAAAAQKSGAVAKTDSPGSKPSDPHALLAEGRQLYKDGKLDEAKQLALRANAATTAHWGLFEDSPDKLLSDIQKTRVKRDQEEADRLLVEGRKLLEKGNLDEAKQVAFRADRLHGAYSIWDLGDRPQKLLADIESARAKNRKVQLPPPVQVVQKDTTKDSSTKAPAVASVVPPPAWPKEAAVAPSGPGSATPAPAGDSRKQAACQLLAQARQFQQQERLLEARQKALEAQKIGVVFQTGEDSPELALLQLSALGQKKVEVLLRQASDNTATGYMDATRYQKADANFAEARQLAVGFGLDTKLIDSKMAWSQQARQRTVAAVPPGTPEVVPIANAPGQGQVSQVQHVEGPANVAGQPGSPGVASPNAAVPSMGQRLLNDGRLELQKGDTIMARRLAEEAFTKCPEVRSDAEALMRSIDAEEFNQRMLIANRSFDAGLSAFYRKEYVQAAAILRTVDPQLLRADRQGKMREIMNRPEMQPSALAQASLKAPDTADPQPGAGHAVASDAGGPAKVITPEQSFAQQTKAMEDVKVQMLREKGLRARTDANAAFKAGDTDRALDILQDYVAELRGTDIDPASIALLQRPVDARLQELKTLKAHADWEKLQASAAHAVDDRLEQKYRTEENKKKQVAGLVDQYQTLFKEGKYSEAEMYAMRAHDLDPDDAMVSAMIYQARTQKALIETRTAKQHREDLFAHSLNDVEDQGPTVTTKNPLFVDPDVMKKANGRKDLTSLEFGPKTEKEREIERKLNSPISLNFTNEPLKQVFDDLGVITGVNVVPDLPALTEDGISLDQPVTMKLEAVAMKSALNLLLHQVHLTYVIKDDVLQITTDSHARGKLVPRTYPVADLVIPVPNSTPAATADLMTVLDQCRNPNVHIGGVQPIEPARSLQTGQTIGSWSGSLASGPPPATPPSPGASTPPRNPNQTMEDVLMKLITNTVAPQSWSEVGGAGTIDYFPLGMALVINQTPDIQEQIAELLAALRRLQDLEVAVEVRLVNLEETFFERIGINFDINIENRNTKQEQLIASQNFQPFGFLNTFRPNNFITGLTPAGTFTNDLNIPITQNSFELAIPPFGGFPNAPGADGGLSLGLAFLSDIQVFMFMEAAQGDRRTNTMQAPKITMFNGQTSSLTVTDFQFFVTGVTVVDVGGQIVFVPQNTPFPIGGLNGSINLVLQTVVSADRRFVRMNLTPTLANLASATVPLFPITTFITPTFDGGQVGQPVPFTQFIQQPNFSTVTVQTTVSVPDGGTVLMGGIKLLNEGRNEFGPPILSKIPYINRLFKNVGYGRDTTSLMIMITPRIIINEEEERLATGVGAGPP
jgi:type II secretory pathway component GspD/PulD (secretin)